MPADRCARGCSPGDAFETVVGGGRIDICGRASGAAARALRSPLISMRSSAICAFNMFIVALRRTIALVASTIDMLASAVSAAVEAGSSAATYRSPPIAEQRTAKVPSISVSAVRPGSARRGGSVVWAGSIMARLAIR
jgi:hypothetical protein